MRDRYHRPFSKDARSNFVYWSGTATWKNSDLLFLFCNFLPAQQSIKRLEFDQMDTYDDMELPTNLCPVLDFLSTSNRNLIKNLRRDNRPITRLRWSAIGFLPTMNTQEFGHLQYLLCWLDELNMDASFTKKLTSLFFLELPCERFGTIDASRLVEKVQLHD